MNKTLICFATAVMQAVHADAQHLILNFSEAMARAETHAYAVAISATAVDEAAAHRRQTRAGHLPTISFVEEVVRGDDPVAAFGTRLRQERFTAADFALDQLNRPEALSGARTVLEISQPLFTSGASLHTRRAARAAEAAAAAMAGRTREQVRLQAAAAYWGLALARQAGDVARAALGAARQHAAEAEAGWRAGTVSRSDRLATELRVAELESYHIDAEAHVMEAADALTLILGCDAGTSVTTTDSLTWQEETPQIAVDGVRPDVQALRWQRTAADHQARAARAASLPQIGAFARVAADARTPFGADGTSWMAGAALRWDLFSGFAVRGATDAARAQVRRLDAEERWLTARVEREIRQAQRALLAANQRVAVARAAVRHADEQLRVVQAESSQGISSVSSRLDAEVAWRSARLRHLQALHDVHLGMAHLIFAAGSMPVTELNK